MIDAKLKKVLSVGVMLAGIAATAFAAGYATAEESNVAIEQQAVAQPPASEASSQQEVDIDAAVTQALDAATREADNISLEREVPAVPETDVAKQQRQIVEMLELSCRQSGYNCEEAKLLRSQLQER